MRYKLLLLFALLFLFITDVDAAKLKVPVITKFGLQTGESNALRVEFSSSNTGTDFSYEIINVNLNKTFNFSGSVKHYTFQNLRNGTYKIIMRACTRNAYDCSDFTDPREAILNSSNNKITKLNTPTITSITSTTNSVTINYRVDDVVSGVEIVNTTTGSIKNVNSSKRSYTWTGLKENKTYNFKIRTYLTDGNAKIYSNFSSSKSITTKKKNGSYSVKKPTLNKLVSTSKSVTLKYTTKGKVTKVEIYNVTANKTKKTSNKKTYTWTGLKENKTYKFKIRSIYKKDGKNYYSSYSSVKGIKTKKAGLTSKQFIAKCDQMSNYIATHGFSYYGHGGAKTFASAKKGGRKTVDCAHFASWAMQETKLIPKGKTFYTSYGKIKGSKNAITHNSKLKVTYTNASVKSLVKAKKLVPGDIIGAKNTTHTMIYRGKTSNGKYVFISAGTRCTPKTIKYCPYKSSYRVGVIIHPKSFDD